MFTDTKYTKIYFAIINAAKGRLRVGYTETHHIIPKCLGGSDDPSNLVKLTAKEHFVCHHLLTKMMTQPNNGIYYGFIAMSVVAPRHERTYPITSSVYAKMKEYNAMLAKEKFSGKQKHNVGKKKYHDPATGEMFFLYADDPRVNDLVLGVSKHVHVGNKHNLGLGVYYYHPVTLVVKRYANDDSAPLGWIKGNPNAATTPGTGTLLYHSPETGEQRKFKKEDQVPPGWIKGSVMLSIRNETECRLINKITESIPDGWTIGRLTKRKGTHK